MKLCHILDEYQQTYSDVKISGICATGSGKNLVKTYLQAATKNEIICHARGTKTLYPDVHTIMEIGGQDSKLILFDQHVQDSNRLAVNDFTMNEMCAAGTGAFLDEQAYRLRIDIQEFASIALKAKSPAHIAGRCAVFAKTDMIHLQQRGIPLADILLGVAYSMARNYLSNLVRGRQLHPRIAFQGGVAENLAIRKAFRDLLQLEDGALIIPEYYKTMGAFGAALFAVEKGEQNALTFAELLERISQESHINVEDSPPISFFPSLSQEIESGNEKETISPPDGSIWVGKSKSFHNIFLGIDIGSVSEKIIAIAEDGAILYHDYRYSHGNVLETLFSMLKTFIESEFGTARVLGVGVTGSGRYLAAKVIGADVVKNEISAQVRGTRHLIPECDTIIEIGGQDSKFITIDQDAHLDFLMNKVCAAGTGSFLQEQAKRLNIDLEREFADLAFHSATPVKLGNKCTVFMESDLVHYTQKGYTLQDLTAGLSYAVAGNFLDRVAQNRSFGTAICFQGGVASNQAVKKAFEQLLNKPVFVPPYHKVTGALGVALLAKEAKERHEYSSTCYQPQSLEMLRANRTFQCHGCSNRCFIQQFSMNSKTIYFGGICGKYEIGGSPSPPPSHQGMRNRLTSPELMERIHTLFHQSSVPCPEKPMGTIGIPRGLMFYEFYPLWNSFFSRAGFRVIPSQPSNRDLIERGMSYVAVETCLPIKVYHGHVLDLLENGVETIFVPGHVHIPSWESNDTSVRHCPYIQGVPEFITTAFDAHIVTQTLSNNADVDGYARKLTSLAYQLLPKRSFLDEALKPYIRGVKLAEYYQQAVEDFKQFKTARYALGKMFLEARSNDEIVYVVFGKPYSIYDPALNMNLFQKMAALGMETIPVDVIEPDTRELPKPLSEVHWHYNRQMLAVAMRVKKDPRLFPIILTNYGCGPDPASFRFFREVFADKPMLVIEIDEHTVDVGIITRLEAFHDEVQSVRRRSRKTAFKDTLADIQLLLPRSRVYNKVYIPLFAEHANILASALRANGTDAVVLPPPDEAVRELGRRHAVGGECQPFINLLGDYVHLLHNNSFDKHSAFFMFMVGGCKMVLYGQNTIYEGKQFYPKTFPVLGTFDQLFGIQLSLSQKVRILDTIFIGMLAMDRLLQKVHECRPYEKEPGTTDVAYKIARNLLCRGIERGETIRGIEDALSVFEGIEVDKTTPKKFVAISGDYYTRINAFANNDLYREIERLGGVIFVPPTLVDVIPIFMVKQIGKFRKRSEYAKLIQFLLLNLELRYQEQKVRNIFEHEILNNFDITPKEVFEKASKYLSTDLSAGVISPIGSVIDTLELGAKGIINVITLNCSFGNIVTSVLQRVRRDYNDVPLLTLICEEQQGGNQLTRLEAFMYQIPEQQW
jgi:predicted CoA-substrate-specific enzyme activase